MNFRFSKASAGLVVLAAASIGCKDKSSVTNQYKFPTTKNIQVQVNIDFKIAPGSGPALGLTTDQFILNAFAIDAAGEEVPLAPEGQTPVLDLPVTVPGPQLSFVAVMQVPSTVQPRASGYALRFSLHPVSTTLGLSNAPIVNLTALRGGVVAGTDPSTNLVNISVASTLAASLTTSSLADAGSDAALTAYANMVSQLSTRLTTVEGYADASKAQDLLVYVSAVVAGLEDQILTDRTFQAQLVASISAAASSVVGDATAGSTFASGLTKSLVAFATDAGNYLGSASTSQAKVFKTNAIPPDSVPTAASYTSAVLAPLAVAYTAASSTVAGSVLVTPPTVTTGIGSYNIYFGGATASTSRGKLLGSIAATASPLALVLPAGTTVPSGDTLVWAYPVSSTGTELSWPTSTAASGPSSSTTYTVTAAGDGNETFTPSAVQTVKPAAMVAYTVTASTGYSLSPSVTGSCPAGSWAGAVYTTGAVVANCTVGFLAVGGEAQLSALVLSAGTLAPTFSATTLGYSASVANTVTAITVTPTVLQSGATMTINGITVASGSASSSIPLTVGLNTITIVVTAANGTPQTYTVVVARNIGVGLNFLHEFDPTSITDGNSPESQMVLAPDGHTLYGMTDDGGTTNNGTIFKIQADGSGFALLHSFGQDASGFNPYGTITVSPDGTTLYGTCGSSTSTAGVLFKINPDGTGFTLLHSFVAGATDGSEPYAGPLLVGNYLYGLTESAGASGDGTIYKIGTDGTGFTLLHSFNGTATDGEEPSYGATLIALGTELYGMTEYGGASGDGTVFKIGMDGTGFQLLHSFTGTGGDGEDPQGGLVILGNTVYGMTKDGGANGDGMIFSVNTDGTNYTQRFQFDGGVNGEEPYGTLTLSADGTKFYGLAYGGGGTYNEGVVFSILPDGTGMTVLDAPTGSGMEGAGLYYGSPLVIGTSVYVAASSNGSNSAGVLFAIGQ